MKIDWLIVGTWAGPILAAFVLGYVSARLERRPKLITWLGHASTVQVQPPNGQNFAVHTHAVVVRNVGKRSATNVRLGHYQYPPNVTVYPDVVHSVNRTPGGGTEILLPTLVPNEQVTITYLYYPPMTYNQVNSYIRSDEGIARVLTVLPTPQLPLWSRRAVWGLLLLGIATAFYLVILLAIWLVTQYR